MDVCTLIKKCLQWLPGYYRNVKNLQQHIFPKADFGETSHFSLNRIYLPDVLSPGCLPFCRLLPHYPCLIPKYSSVLWEPDVIHHLGEGEKKPSCNTKTFTQHKMHIQYVQAATSICSCSQVDCTSKCTMCHDMLDECSVLAGRAELSSICINVQLTPVIHLFVSSQSREMDHCPVGYKCWQQAELLIRKGKLAEALSL